MEIPLSLAYVAAVLIQDGHDVRILDSNIVLSKEEFFQCLKQQKFDVLGFTSTTASIHNCMRVIKMAKTLHPGAKVILGGWHASALPRETMDACSLIDFIVKGEGEETMKELVRSICDRKSFKDIKGIFYRDANGNIVETPDRPLIQDLDSLPFPARHLLPLERYDRMGVSYMVYNLTPLEYTTSTRPITSHLITSRGCYNRCSFCADHVIYKQKYRAHGPERVVAEMKDAVDRLNVRIFNIIDQTFLLNQKRVEKICKLIVQQGLQIRWCCQGRVDRPLPVGLLRLMKRAGCMKIYYGIESGSPRILRVMNKNLKIKNIKAAIFNTKKAGIGNHVFFLYGFPEETMRDYYLTRQLVWELKPDNIEVHKVIPLPGTDLYKYGTENDCLSGRDWNDFHYYFKEGVFFKKECLPADAERIYSNFFSLSKQFNLSIHYFINFIKRIKSIYYLVSILKVTKVFIEYFALLNPNFSLKHSKNRIGKASWRAQ